MKTMDQLEHRKRHKCLHNCLDELLADWIQHGEGMPSQPVSKLLDWSHAQTQIPDHVEPIK